MTVVKFFKAPLSLHLHDFSIIFIWMSLLLFCLDFTLGLSYPHKAPTKKTLEFPPLAGPHFSPPGRSALTTALSTVRTTERSLHCTFKPPVQIQHSKRTLDHLPQFSSPAELAEPHLRTPFCTQLDQPSYRSSHHS